MKQIIEKWKEIIPHMLIVTLAVLYYSSVLVIAESNNGEAGTLADVEFYTETKESEQREKDKIILPQTGIRNESYLVVIGGLLLISTGYANRHKYDRGEVGD